MRNILNTTFSNEKCYILRHKIKEINKEISKATRKNIIQQKHKQIFRSLKQIKSIKVIRRRFTNGRNEIFQLKDEKGSGVTDKEKLIQVVEVFHTALYKSQIYETKEEPSIAWS